MTKVWVLIEADLHMDDPIGDTPIIGVFSSREEALAVAELGGEVTWSDGQDEGPCGSWERSDHWVGIVKATPDYESPILQVTGFELDEPS
jgi:hypothetical protein